MLSSPDELLETGIDGAALKPSEVDLARATDLPFDLVTIDYEGASHVPDPAVLRELARSLTVRVTVPVRADGFDPLGDDRVLSTLPSAVHRVIVAGHPAFLSGAERARAVARRLGAAVERSVDPWVGTESVERIALATGATQFALLSPRAAADVSALRAAGFAGEFAVYAPTVFSEDEDEILDALGGYVARRGSVRSALPEDPTVDRRARGPVRRTLLDACTDYALIGDAPTITDRVRALKSAGADYVIGYPARGLDEFVRGP